jgi:hypothetical protein
MAIHPPIPGDYQAFSGDSVFLSPHFGLSLTYRFTAAPDHLLANHLFATFEPSFFCQAFFCQFCSRRLSVDFRRFRFFLSSHFGPISPTY